MILLLMVVTISKSFLFFRRTFQNGMATLENYELKLLQINLFSGGKRLWIFICKQVCEISLKIVQGTVSLFLLPADWLDQ